MINLREYYLKYCTQNSYHYRYYDNILNNYVETLPFEYETIEKSDLKCYDEIEIIKVFKESLYPNSQTDFSDYILLTFYLFNNDYSITIFPKELGRPTDNFSSTIRSYIISKNPEKYEILGKVTWAERKTFIDNMEVIKISNKKVEEELNNLFKKVSTRNASFSLMTEDERLKEIVNLLELLFDQYNLPIFSTNIENYISKKKITDMKGILQCFRHSKYEDLEKRKCFSQIDKTFLIDIGIIYLEYIYKNGQKKQN
jgi:hypothetical protein